MNADGEGIRLSRQVAAAQGCSRREAEALIFSGAVRVDGQVVTDPARRVRDEALEIESAATHPALQALTLLLHQDGPAPVQADRLAALTSAQAPAPASRLARLQALLPLPSGAEGLCVFSDDPSIVRRLHDPHAPLEQEWLASVRGQPTPAQLDALQHPGLRISLNRQGPEQSVLRVAGKAATGEGFVRWLADRLPLLALRRQRIGRLGLAPLAAGQWRTLRPGERF
jgi:23S rRNA pseudouridine2604 synthase